MLGSIIMCGLAQKGRREIAVSSRARVRGIDGGAYMPMQRDRRARNIQTLALIIFAEPTRTAGPDQA